MHIVLNILQYPIEYMDSLTWCEIVALADKKIEQQKQEFETFSFAVSVGINNAMNKKKIAMFNDKAENTNNKKMKVVEGLGANKQRLIEEMNERFQN